MKNYKSELLRAILLELIFLCPFPCLPSYSIKKILARIYTNNQYKNI